MSNGTSDLTFRDPSDFSVMSTITVSDGVTEVDMLNELECVGEVIYANVWSSNLIVAIDKSSGDVLYTIDASSLSNGESKDPNAVLNGIAHVPEYCSEWNPAGCSDAFLLTGKNWSSMHLVSFTSEERNEEEIPPRQEAFRNPTPFQRNENGKWLARPKSKEKS